MLSLGIFGLVMTVFIAYELSVINRSLSVINHNIIEMVKLLEEVKK